MDKTWASRVTDMEALGWSLTGLGRAIGLSAQSVSDIKQGRTESPRGMAAVQLYLLHNNGATPPVEVDANEGDAEVA